MTPEQFLLFADPLPEPTLLLTGAGLILAGNRAIETRLGLTLAQLLDRNLAEVVQDPSEEVAHFLRLCSRSRTLVLGAMVLHGEKSGGTACRVEGAVIQPRTETSDAVVLLRLVARETASEQFIVLNRRIEELGKEVQRRKHAETLARQQEDRLRVTLRSIGDAVIVTDPAGRVVTMNLVAETLTGWTQDQAVGQPLDIVFHIVSEETRGPVDNPALRALREGVVVGLANHTLLICRDGTERPIDDSAAPIRDSHGEVFGAVLVFRDLSSRLQAEMRVRASEQRFQSFMANSPATAFIKDSKGRYLYVNQRIEQAFGRPMHEWIGKTDYDLFPHDLAEQYHANDEKVRISGTASQFKETARDQDRLHHYLSFKFPLQDRDGSWLLAGMSIDITEQLRAEESLRESEERFRTLANSIPQLAWTSRADGHIFWYNQRWYEYTGTTPEQMEGWGWERVHDPEVLPEVLQRWQASIRTGDPFDMVFPIRGADGRFRPFLTRVVPLKDRNAQVVQWFGTNTDISELQAMEQALREEDRRKDEFLATLAHELRNPLAPIRNGLQIMRLAGHDRAAFDQARSMMERQLQHLVRLVDDLLDLSRITQGKIHLQRERIDLATVVLGAVEAADPLVRQAGQELTVTLPEEPVLVDADKVRLVQAVSNLLGNAVKYSDRGSRIWLSLECKQNEALVSVRDKGVGIPAPMLSKVFEMFTQVDRSLEKSQGGLGIGLSIVKLLIEMHGGSVEARSAGHGMGSEFILRLPTVLSPRHLPQDRVSIRDPGPTRRHRILVVDDNVDAAESLAMMLQLLGNEVRIAHDGLAGVAMAEEYRPDLILLDIGMPYMNGYDACRRIREQSWGKRIAIVALTGWGQDEDRRRAQEAGFNNHLVKPVEPATIEKLLAELKGQPVDG